MNNRPTCMEVLIGRKNMFLQDSDWTQLGDAPLSESKKLEWVEYRQKLRELVPDNPHPQWVDGDDMKLPDVDWPKKPL